MRHRLVLGWTFVSGLVLLGSLAATPAHALPDLVPEIETPGVFTDQTVVAGDVVEGCAATTTGLVLVRFGVRFWNFGDEALVLGDPHCPNCLQFPGAVCGDPRFECSPAGGHNHPHYLDFARYELLDHADNLLAIGTKRTFCVQETYCPPAVPIVYTCTDQGIQPGCFDLYAADVGCQYIDATGVPDVTTRALRIRVTIDPDETLPDADRTNNVTVLDLPGCGDGTVSGTEECDPADPASASCCDIATCRFRPAGTLCRASRTPCDPAERCSGRDAACPADDPGLDPCPTTGGCGDGEVAGEEECDPADPANAACCDPVTCLFRDAGTSCRPSHDACDPAERCTGRDEACPDDVTMPDDCAIGARCVASGTIAPDGCATCDPAGDPGGWTSPAAGDPDGLRCLLPRVAAACPASRVAKLVHRITRAIDLVTAKATVRHDRRLERTVVRLVRGVARSGCDATQASAVRDRAITFLSARSGARPHASSVLTDRARR